MCWTMNMDRHKKKWARSIFEDRRRTQFYKVYTCIITRDTKLGPIYLWLLWKKLSGIHKWFNCMGCRVSFTFSIYAITSYMSQVDLVRFYMWQPICVFKNSLISHKVIRFMEHRAVTVATILLQRLINPIHSFIVKEGGGGQIDPRLRFLGRAS